MHIDWMLGECGVERNGEFKEVVLNEPGAKDECHHDVMWWLDMVV